LLTKMAFSLLENGIVNQDKVRIETTKIWLSHYLVLQQCHIRPIVAQYTEKGFDFLFSSQGLCGSLHGLFVVFICCWL
jgi:hypothetical protein